MRFVVAIAALELAPLFPAALWQVARGDPDGIFVRGGKLLLFTGIGKGGLQIPRAGVRRGLQMERCHGLYHRALHRAE